MVLLRFGWARKRKTLSDRYHKLPPFGVAYVVSSMQFISQLHYLGDNRCNLFNSIPKTKGNVLWPDNLKLQDTSHEPHVL